MGWSISAISAGGGKIGICPAPGYRGSYRHDFRVVSRWRPGLVLSMTTPGELAHTGASDLMGDLAGIGCIRVHFPVVDFGAPGDGTRDKWSETSAVVRAVLADGGRVLVHCRGGCGRSGMAIVRIMAEMGEPPGAALARLRAVRPCAVETAGQYAWASRSGEGRQPRFPG